MNLHSLDRLLSHMAQAYPSASLCSNIRVTVANLSSEMESDNINCRRHVSLKQLLYVWYINKVRIGMDWHDFGD